ncbi:hypothetical protein ACWDSD_21210 [Streptomyces spiralis]|uniref:Uncharacterized protein n=1 Tax=Streptomyces spiralis TaxID=66376 RepID=A0A919A1U8_9ACTN|nr:MULTISPECIES: hypothetical protein [Streptomyces]GHE83849.1 hypothetical protein GCM10014715_44660 [Streptomyces spiralis]
MGWTHDYSDVAHTRRSASGPGSLHEDARQLTGADPRVGIPRILRRRARWVSVRLRHPRG